MVDIYGHKYPYYVHAFYVHRLCIIEIQPIYSNVTYLITFSPH